jgi:hypothetical protein
MKLQMKWCIEFQKENKHMVGKREIQKIGKVVVSDRIVVDFGMTRKDGYGFITDYEDFEITGNCKNCGHQADIEQFLITKNGKVIPLTCPICYKSNIKIKDER